MPTSRPRVLLLSGGPIHDTTLTAPIVDQTIARLFQVENIHDPNDLTQLAGGDFAAVVLFYTRLELSDEAFAALKRFVEGGGGLLALHGATAFKGQDHLAELIGCRFAEHGPVHEFTVMPCDPDHPVVARTMPFKVVDELYIMEPFGQFHTFATAHWQGVEHPIGYQKQVGKGRVLMLANGHDVRSITNRYVKRMIERAVRVAVGETFDHQFTAGILGYGGSFNMGKSHALAFGAQVGCDVVAVCDLDPKRTEQAKTELGDHIKTWNDAEAFFAEGQFDVCIEILPHNLHAEFSIKALQAGKHVVTEKPFCLTLDEADAMIAAADAAGKILSVYHNRRWDNDYLALLNLIRANEIGTVFRIDAATAGYGAPRNWWRTRKQISGGAMYDWGAHYCDWTLGMMNKPIESVTGDFQKRKWFNMTNEDYTYALIRFRDGTTATLEQGSLAAIGRGGFRILGTEGGLSNDGPHKAITIRKYDSVHGMIESHFEPKGPDTSAAFYQNIANHLIMGEELVVKPAEARRAIGVIHLAERSAAQNGQPLPMPGEDHYAETCNYMTPW